MPRIDPNRLARPLLLGVLALVAHLALLGVLDGATALGAGSIDPAPQEPARDNIGHEHHRHAWGPKHPVVLDPRRFLTSREAAALPLPEETDAFTFAVFGDRTGGPVEGVSVLAEAVRDVNLVEPDLVMTVGDLVEGYNTTPQWMEQMREFQGIMDELRCPWFPVAGNHDIYWRGDGRPPGEHEASYEMHFGPLWYAFEHKDCWFVALYTDEGDPETGEKNFGKPECQRMSEEQFAWLRDTLEKAAGAKHVFLFLHHPRWLDRRYGDDWERVHRLLVDAGNVTAVFAGHIHQMRYDPRDGIEYLTLATVGGHQNGYAPQAGWLHQFHLVTVRGERISLAAVPVGEMMDVREITGDLVTEVRALTRLEPILAPALRLGEDGAASGTITATLTNPSSRPIDVMVRGDSADSRWWFTPDHDHAVLAPGERRVFELEVSRPASSADASFRLPELAITMDYLARAHRYAIPEKRVELPLDLAIPRAEPLVGDWRLRLDGRRGYAEVPSDRLPLPDGAFTLECRFRAESFGARVGLVAKTENSEYGLFVSEGRPSFSVFLGERYVEAKHDGEPLQPGSWHHLAGVFDGAEVRLYLDGQRVAARAGSGARRTNDLPLLIGADVRGDGRPMSFFHGEIDGVRLSSEARYAGERFDGPVEAHAPHTPRDTLLLVEMDPLFGPWLYDHSGHGAHPRLEGGASVIDATIPPVVDPPSGAGSGQ